jgi:hypothetical protein
VDERARRQPPIAKEEKRAFAPERMNPDLSGQVLWGTLRPERVQASQCGAAAVRGGACGSLTPPMRLNERVAGGHHQPELQRKQARLFRAGGA